MNDFLLSLNSEPESGCGWKGTDRGQVGDDSGVADEVPRLSISELCSNEIDVGVRIGELPSHPLRTSFVQYMPSISIWELKYAFNRIVVSVLGYSFASNLCQHRTWALPTDRYCHLLDRHKNKTRERLCIYFEASVSHLLFNRNRLFCSQCWLSFNCLSAPSRQPTVSSSAQTIIGCGSGDYATSDEHWNQTKPFVGE